MAKYAEVIVPVAVGDRFTYLIPEELKERVRPMSRVFVPFGRGKTYTGIVTSLADTFDGGYELKEILACPDPGPVLRYPQLKLWDWIAAYYMCAPGQVLKAALPTGLNIESETEVILNDDIPPEALTERLESAPSHLTSKLNAILSLLSHNGKMTVHELEKNGVKDAVGLVNGLVGAGIVTVREKLSERFRPRTEELIHVVIDRDDHAALQKAFRSLRSQRHERLLLKLIELSRFTRAGAPLEAVSRDAIAGDESYDRSVLNSFVKKGFITLEKREVSRFRWNGGPLKPLPELSAAQKTALSEIHESFREQPVVLLHGVTSSGKTEIFMHLIDFVLKQKRQVLYLVPEIALTTQLTRRLQDVFGPKVVIYHSRFSDRERCEIWMKLLTTDEPCVVVGARSAVFLPFATLGMVIVDEEHEQSYKQFDPAPRYNARDVATVLARMHGARTLLASATPSVDSYYKATQGRYGLVTLGERYAGVRLPDIEVVDLAKAQRSRSVTESLAHRTIEVCREALGNKHQVIVFNNRRGYSPVALCPSCQFIPRCRQCDVSLTYHKSNDRLVCHYCGAEYEMPKICPSCKEPGIRQQGYGTERVEDNVAECFPEARILRMDLDTTRNKENYSTLIDKFSQHKADILVGTQMVTKGLDFADVSTVAVLGADTIINYPDFRSAERAFNMLEQVSGRAGRRADTPGKVLIQTRQPDHRILKHVLEHDYKAFFDEELAERRQFAYPPFVRIIYVYVRHKDNEVCAQAASHLASMLRSALGDRVFGPQTPPVARIKGVHLRRIMVKIEPEVSVSQVKTILAEASTALRTEPKYRAVSVHFDVDPF